MNVPSTAVILLAGGLGTRLRSVIADVPKPMVPVSGEPFLEWVLRYFERQGLHRFVVTLGHLPETAEKFLQERRGSSIVITHERELLGTGGATVMASEHVDDVELLVVANADSLVLADLSGIWSLFDDPECDAAIVALSIDDASRYGSLAVDTKFRLQRFVEKQPGKGLINAGIYVLRRRVLSDFPDQVPLSLERDVFPHLLAKNRCIRIFPVNAPFLDIGTPESYAESERFITGHFFA